MTRRASGYSPIDINLEGLLLNEYIASSDADWLFTNIKGWTGGPGVQVDQVQRVASHGQFPQEGRRTGRPLTLEGVVICDDEMVVAEATDIIAACLADGEFGTLTVGDDRLGPRWATVQLVGAIDDDWSTPTAYRFQLQLLAPDPLKYGAMSTDSSGFFSVDPNGGLEYPLDSPLDYGNDPTAAPGVVTVSNQGTAASPVVFTVAGPTAPEGFRITDLLTGKSITYLGGEVPGGSSVVFNGRNASVIINGVADRSGVTYAQAWPKVGAGETRSFFFESFGADTGGVLTAECISAWT